MCRSHIPQLYSSGFKLGVLTYKFQFIGSELKSNWYDPNQVDIFTKFYHIIMSQISVSSCELISSLFIFQHSVFCAQIISVVISCTYKVFLYVNLTVNIVCNERKSISKNLDDICRLLNLWLIQIRSSSSRLAYFNYLASCWLAQSLMLYSVI